MSTPTGYAIRTTYKGDVAFVRASVGLDLRVTVALVADPEPQDVLPDQATAERWARRVARVDPSLPLDVVPV